MAPPGGVCANCTISIVGDLVAFTVGARLGANVVGIEVFLNVGARDGTLVVGVNVMLVGVGTEVNLEGATDGREVVGIDEGARLGPAVTLAGIRVGADEGAVVGSMVIKVGDIVVNPIVGELLGTAVIVALSHCFTIHPINTNQTRIAISVPSVVLSLLFGFLI